MSPSIPVKAKSTLGESHPQLMEVVLGELRQLILDFELPPGAHLVEAQLADRLGVSRNPVREAIRTLAAESFVEISPRRGAFVATLTPADAKHIFEVRLALEPLGARLAAANGSQIEVRQLQESIERARDAMTAGHLDTLADLNTKFHILVMEMSGNPYLTRIAIPTIKRAQWIYRQNAETRAPHSWSEHLGLIEAIAVGDEEAAEAEARNHVTAARLSFRMSAAQGQ